MDKKQQIVNLWRTCFGDSEAFISLYFDRVYKDEILYGLVYTRVTGLLKTR